MAKAEDGELSRRERQIMDVIYQRGQASVAEVLEDLPEPPGYSAVRALLRILEEKGHLKHQQRGNKYIYLPRRSRRAASKSALRRLVDTFFDGSTERAMAALLEDADTKLSDDELERISKRLQEARKQERRS